jgi:hypothetical protein
MPFYYCYPNTEIHGKALLSIIHSVDSAVVRHCLVKHGLVCIEPDQWYSAQTVLNFITDVTEQFEHKDQIPPALKEILDFRDWLCRLFPVRCTTTGNLKFAV